MLIDTHAHIFKEYYDDIDEILLKNTDKIIIVCGTNNDNNKEIIEMCKKHRNVYGTIGIHPSEIHLMTEGSLKFIEENLNNDKIIGIGEIGLDYYYNKNYDQQKEIFDKQLNLAQKYNKTVVIHSREALIDTYDTLEKYPNLKKIMHCYTYDLENARKFISINCKLGIGGIITFKNNQNIYNVVKNIDLKHIVIETDSPYLTPVPYRGKRNESTYLNYIADKIAEIKHLSKEEVYQVTTANAIEQFDLNINL